MAMNETRRTFLAAAETACSVLAWPAVSDGWDAASALPRMTVGHLVAHLARGVTMVERYLDQAAPEADSATISAAEYYAAMLGASGDMDSVLNSGVRDRATRDAAPGFSAVAASLYECTERLRGSVLRALTRRERDQGDVLRVL